MGECASTPSHILLTPYRLTPHCAVTPTQTRHKHAYSPHVVQPSVHVMSWIAMKNKTMHRPLLKIPVKYMDTEKAQAEHSAENTTLAVTVISWKVLRRLSCKSICAIYMGEELCWPQLFFFYQTGLSHQSKLCEFTWMSEKKYEVEGSTIWGKVMEHVRRAGGGVSALVSACHTWHIGPELPKVPFWALLLAKALKLALFKSKSTKNSTF